MSKLCKQKLNVVTDAEGCPVIMLVPGKKLAVMEVLDRWYDTGCWWEGEAVKLFWRLSLQNEQVWEVYLDLGDNSWYLYKVYD